MTIKRHKGVLDLTIPETPGGNSNPKMTIEAISKWRDQLPMADTGAASKSVYLMLTEMVQTPIDPQLRFELIEAIRPQVKQISTTLKRHYIEQHEPLTEQKIKVADLRQLLMTLMADNYKMVLDNVLEKSRDQKFICTVICRILYYYSIILICRYQLYSYIPKGMWAEIYNIYKYAKERKILNIKIKEPALINQGDTHILQAFIRIILMNATDPYQWRQKDQHTLSKAIDLWSMYPEICEHDKIPDDHIGVYVFDLEKDFPPEAYNFREEPITDTCIALDLKQEVKHLQDILKKMHNNELRAKIDHPNDPEFSVTIPTIQKLITVWSSNITRTSPRFPLSANVEIVFGLSASHFYLNNMQDFDSTPKELNIDDQASAKTAAIKSAVKELPTMEVEDEDEDEEEQEENGAEKNSEEKEEVLDLSKLDTSYKVYKYEVEDISPGGMCLIVNDHSYPPFQAGEIVAFKNPMGDVDSWSVGALRWLKRNREEKFLLGVQLIAPYASPAGMQVIRKNKPAGHLLRCLALPSMPELDKPSTIITPGIPLHANKVMLYIEGQNGVITKLTKETEATGMYYQYEYASSGKIAIKKRKIQHEEVTTDDKKIPPKNIDTEFDSLWKDL